MTGHDRLAYHHSATYLIKIADGDEGYSIALCLAVPYGYRRQAVLLGGTHVEWSGTGARAHTGTQHERQDHGAAMVPFLFPVSSDVCVCKNGNIILFNVREIPALNLCRFLERKLQRWILQRGEKLYFGGERSGETHSLPQYRRPELDTLQLLQRGILSGRFNAWGEGC